MHDTIMSQYISILLILMLVLGPSFNVFANELPTVLCLPVVDHSLDSTSNRMATAICDQIQLSGQYQGISINQIKPILNYYQQSINSDNKYSHLLNLMDTAKSHYYDFQFEEAHSVILKVLDDLDGFNDMAAWRLRLDAQLTDALILQSMKDKEAVESALHAICRDHPMIELSADYYPPKLIKAINKEKESQSKTKQGRLQIQSDPPAAQVYVNGWMAGITPLTISSLPVGGYHIAIVANHYQTTESNVEIFSNDITSVNQRLKWAVSTVTSDVMPSNDDQIRMQYALNAGHQMHSNYVLMVDSDPGIKSAHWLEVQVLNSQKKISRAPLLISLDDQLNLTMDSEVKMMTHIFADLKLQNHDVMDHTYVPFIYNNPVIVMGEKKSIFKRKFIWGSILTTLGVGLITGIVLSSGENNAANSGTMSIHIKDHN